MGNPEAMSSGLVPRKRLGLYLDCPKRGTVQSPGSVGRAVKIEPVLKGAACVCGGCGQAMGMDSSNFKPHTQNRSGY